MTDRIPPHDCEAEKAVLGSMLLEGEACEAMVALLSADDFYRGAHRIIFTAIRTLALKGGAGVVEQDVPVDEITLRDALGEHLEEVGGSAYIHELASTVPSAANVETYAEIVRRLATQRRAIQACTGTLRDLEGARDGVAEIIARGIDRLADAGEGIEQEKPLRFEDAIRQRKPQDAWPLAELDKLQTRTGGIYAGGLTLVSGPPGAGKTTLCMQILGSIAKSGNPVYIWSYDQRPEELASILWASTEHCEIDRLQAPPPDLPLHFDQGDFTLARVLQGLKREVGMGVRWFLLDYLSLMTADGYFKRDWEKSAHCGKELKKAAQRLNVYFLLIQSSVKPEGETPHPKYIAGGNELVHAADQVWWLQPPKPDAVGDPTQCFIFKNRRAATGLVLLDFKGAQHRFESWEGR